MLKRAAHPGKIIKEELAQIGVTPTELARQIEVPANRMSQIINGKRSITGDTALRLGHWVNIEPQFWMNLQTQFDLVSAERNAGDEIKALPTAALTAQGKGDEIPLIRCNQGCNLIKCTKDALSR